MPDYEHHFLMNEADAARYAAEKLDFFAPGAALHATEIGDGNINYVFRVQDENGRSLILKQSDARIRTGTRILGTARSRIEAEAMQWQARFAPGLVPEVYAFDAAMSCIAMEDLRGHDNLRHALLARKTFPQFVQHITTFLAETLLRSTDCVLPPAEKKQMAARFTNPALCDITERLVYTDPYTDHGGENEPFGPNRVFLEQALYRDRTLHLEAARLKTQFQTKAQALLHGDLHTGSIFVTPSSTKVLDAEFAFYGPIGYDVGCLVANLAFAWANAQAVMPEGGEKAFFTAWLEETLAQVIDRFSRKALAILREDTRDVMYRTPAFAEWYLHDILADAAGVAGLELNRRVIGTAKVADMESIENPAQRMLAERTCVLAAGHLIKKRHTGFAAGGSYIATLREALKAARVLGA